MCEWSSFATFLFGFVRFGVEQDRGYVIFVRIYTKFKILKSAFLKIIKVAQLARGVELEIFDIRKVASFIESSTLLFQNLNVDVKLV